MGPRASQAAEFGATPRGLAHDFVARVLGAGDNAVDATLGNGHDCAFLARLVGPIGRVIGFDIQDAALAATAQRIEASGLASRVTLVSASHATLGAWIRTNAPGLRIKAAMG